MQIDNLSLEAKHSEVSTIATAEAYRSALKLLANGTGPIAADAERASGFRYSQRPYLIQLYRRDAGVFLLDPPALGDLSELTRILGDQLWILHAAHQDLPNLYQHGIYPARIFDTELAARLLGFERFGLAALLEQTLQIHLAKEHSAADWSTRPLPESWLVYAALDVEYLIDLYDFLLDALKNANKQKIAETEFANLLRPKQKTKLADPWRKLSGIHQLRTRDQLAMARALWQARDEYAQATDTAPGRIVPDKSLVALVQANPASFHELMQLSSFTGRESRSEAKRWWAALEAGRSAKQKPELKTERTGLPPVSIWKNKFPEAHLRLEACKPKLNELAEGLEMPHENLLTPEFLRKLAFTPPEPITAETIALQLMELGARDWQISAVAQIISDSFVESLQNPTCESSAES